MYTTLMETGEWIKGDKATGRLTNIPNGQILSSNIDNYTKDNNFIWDEITVPITHDSNWQKAMEIIRQVVASETAPLIEQAEKVLSKMGEKYYTSEREIDPTIFLTLTDNWINFNVRYIAYARERRKINNAISRQIIQEIQNTEDIEIASETIDIIGFPNDRK